MHSPEHCLIFLILYLFTLFFYEGEYNIANWCEEKYKSIYDIFGNAQRGNGMSVTSCLFEFGSLWMRHVTY